MPKKPWIFTESPDGVLRVEGIIQRAFPTRGIKGDLFNQTDILKLENLMRGSRGTAEHYEDPVIGESHIGRCINAKIIGEDVHIDTEILPPPHTPVEQYEYAREKLRKGEWTGFSISTLSKNDRYTRQADPDTRRVIEFSYCKEPAYPHCQFTAVSASKQSMVKSIQVLTYPNSSSCHKERTNKMAAPTPATSSYTKEQISELFKEINPEVPQTEVDKIQEADYNNVVLTAAKRAIADRKKSHDEMQKVMKSQTQSRAAKGAALANKLAPSLVPKEQQEEFVKVFTEEAPMMKGWPVFQKAMKRNAENLAELDTWRATNPEVVVQASKRNNVAANSVSPGFAHVEPGSIAPPQTPLVPGAVTAAFWSELLSDSMTRASAVFGE